MDDEPGFGFGPLSSELQASMETDHPLAGMPLRTMSSPESHHLSV